MPISTEIRQIVPGYAVSAQLLPSDMAELAAMGVTTIIDNRPDAEIEADVQAGAMQQAAEAAGIAFVYNPVISGGMTLGNVEEQMDAADASEGDVVAYCRSGTRSATVWALGRAGEQPTPEILGAVEQAGYPMPQLGPQIDALASRER